jgi:16S rRNA (guanine1207-N2)-methyltransferase
VPSMPSSFHWLDLEGEKVERKYDVAVMNPPFHQGRAADPGIGLAMIRAAAAGLKAGGRLFVVANRGLPYDAALNTAFGKVTELAADKTFRVWLARR